MYRYSVFDFEELGHSVASYSSTTPVGCPWELLDNKTNSVDLANTCFISLSKFMDCFVVNVNADGDSFVAPMLPHCYARRSLRLVALVPSILNVLECR